MARPPRSSNDQPAVEVDVVAGDDREGRHRSAHQGVGPWRQCHRKVACRVAGGGGSAVVRTLDDHELTGRCLSGVPWVSAGRRAWPSFHADHPGDIPGAQGGVRACHQSQQTQEDRRSTGACDCHVASFAYYAMSVALQRQGVRSLAAGSRTTGTGRRQSAEASSGRLGVQPPVVNAGSMERQSNRERGDRLAVPAVYQGAEGRPGSVLSTIEVDGELFASVGPRTAARHTTG